MNLKVMKLKDRLHASTTVVCVAILGCLFAFGLPDTSLGQSALNSGQIAGQVLDPSGAAVPGVEISVRNLGTNYGRTVTTDDSGRYVLESLPLGTYEVMALPTNLAASTQEVYVSLGGQQGISTWASPRSKRRWTSWQTRRS